VTRAPGGALTRLGAVLAVGLSMVGGATAHAAGPNVVHGGCFLEQIGTDGLSGDTHAAIIGDRSVTTDASGLPIDATVSCWVAVNGAEAPGTRFSYSGPGVQAGADRTSYVAGFTDTVSLCQSVAYADNTTDSTCYVDASPQIPPQAVDDFINYLFTFVDPMPLPVDAIVCPLFGALAGEYPGGLVIDVTGDVTVPDPFGGGTIRLYDCPPYDV